ncbi:MAG: hypothetical protein ACD_70C00036G0001 [uncultured bacterium]|nr:MAG: hypothetical protein ACD_70C00036G0001 [uncultured bacterium]OGT25396.1 MAG: ubiquinone biosynthesis regulatory protein kinase UbiB [Gammaproteobacteria bacterium RIFCSPHIGHO2_02_FULL_42_43]OGT51348.1 MAG: ubiquinone biosynthesis regulatory protein kinase UbiB [Gammaproteobacteria bacterium RIFCSPHIGHO2_12_FULL_41_25]OGT62050.1 MAG: ubiquinone biosynthesis regulatory protein kinase UbiB [Gammaproteobacteria bacterium RIFCSPLOWO2_02_FULL_42_14]OGT85723.1 MAG: ubiquinone biosynthesis regu
MIFVELYRISQIFSVLMQNAVNRRVIPKKNRRLRALSFLNPFSFINRHYTRGEAIRITLEKLGPIYVKFGQLLSTRSDMIPDDIIKELEKLQDRVPPFDGDLAVQLVESAFQKKIHVLYLDFDKKPLASASIAQVHAATLKTGESVIVKILRPRILKTIRHDMAVLKLCATLIERLWKHGKRLRAVSLVKEFEKTTKDELDLMREAANASQLRRNFSNSQQMYVPKVYWENTCETVMTMERIYGVQISDIAALKQSSVNLKKLSEYGVEIFFTQVFRDAFFHADMHPGNLFIDVSDPENPRYLGVDFGIMGTLSPKDQQYLAQNILAFLSRDYRRVAQLHIDSGWVSCDTRVDEFESAIRTVCEPIFEKPLSHISFGHLLLKLFQTAERFHMTVQPQLMLLQKTLFYIESLGRKLYPDLDIWETAKPLMTRWMREQRSPRTLLKKLWRDFPENMDKLIQLPGLLFDLLNKDNDECE